MNVYYLVCVLTLFIQWWLPGETEKQYKWKLFWTLVPLFLFGALRVNFGLDYSVYEMIFDETHSDFFVLDSSAHSELGFQLLCSILPTYRTLLVLTSFLLCTALGVFLYNYVPKQYLGFALLLIFLNPEKNIHINLVAIRHGIITSAFLLGFVWAQKRKLIPYAILTLAMMYIHTSAVLFYPLAYIVVRRTPFTKKELFIWITVLIVLISASMTGLINFIAPIINSYFYRYETYINALQDNAHRGSLLVFANVLFMIGVFYTLYAKSDYLYDWENSILRGGLLFLSTAFMGAIAMRSSLIYDMLFISSVCVVMNHFKRKDFIRIMMEVLSVVVSIYSMFIVWMHNSHWTYAHYQSVFSS